MKAVAILLLFAILLLGPSPARARVDCRASGSSDTVTAEAVAVCSVQPDGLILEPLNSSDCEVATYDVVVADDTELAVFPNEVVAGYRSRLETGPNVIDGRANNFGTVLDVLGFGPDAQPIGVALNPNVGERRFSETGRWWRRICWRHTTESDGRMAPSTVDGPHPEGNVIRLSELVAAARAQVDPPPVPAFEHSGPVSLMQLPTWFWADQAWWNTPRRGERSHGNASVAVAAVPASWDLRSEAGKLTSCAGRGRTWQRGLADRRGCTHTFSQPVPEGTVSLQFTVTMDVAWSTSLSGYGVQSLPPILRTVRQDHGVIEVVGLRG